jgi:hypothetical protein
VPALRARFAPGVLGDSLAAGALAALLAAVGGVLLGRAVRATPGGGDSVTRREGSTDPTVRMARMAARRLREQRLARAGGVLAKIVPGLCALQKGRPVLGFVSVAAAVAVVVCFVARDGIVPDAFAAGALGSLLFGVGVGVAAVFYGVATGLSFVAEEGERCP